MKTDTTVFELIEKEHQRQLKGIELIASENFVSDEVMKAMGSWLTNKYAEGYPGKRYYGGCQVVDEVESLAIERVCKLFGAEYANVQPHSGAQANAAVFLACLKPGDTFMGLNLDHGGHLSHGSAVNTSGILYHAIGYNLNKETGRVDYDEMEKLALEHRPKMIIGGGSAYSREWDYARMREIADKVGAIFMVDMAHPAGLIAAGLLENPVKYAHIVYHPDGQRLRQPLGIEDSERRGEENEPTAQQCRFPRYPGRSAGACDCRQGRGFQRGVATRIQGMGQTGTEECQGFGR